MPDGENEALTCKTLAMALAGGGAAPGVCLERARTPPPQSRSPTFALPPMACTEDALWASGWAARSSEGDQTTSESVSIMPLIESCRRMLETAELEARLLALETARA
jgi:hypothetical protein